MKQKWLLQKLDYLLDWEKSYNASLLKLLLFCKTLFLKEDSNKELMLINCY